MVSAVRILLVGAKGRMGRAIAAAGEKQKEVDIVAELDQGDDLAARIGDCDVVVDFSHASATGEICRVCLAAGKPLVTGTTGHSPEERAVLEKAASSLAIVLSPNFSVGVNALSLVDPKSVGAAGRRFRSRDCRDPSPAEKGRAERDSEEIG